MRKRLFGLFKTSKKPSKNTRQKQTQGERASPPPEMTTAREKASFKTQSTKESSTLSSEESTVKNPKRSTLVETDYDDGYTQLSDQEALKKRLFEIHRQFPASFFDISRTPQFEYFFRHIMQNDQMAEFIDLYQRYRNNHLKIKEFHKMDQIIRDPNLMPFWIKVLGREDELIAFHKIPTYQRHRLQNQPDDEPDQRHPFDIIAGYYFYMHVKMRANIIKLYFKVRHFITKNNFSKALKFYEKSIIHYHPKTKKDRAAKNALFDQLDILETITNWSDPNELAIAQKTLSEIHRIMESVIAYQSEDLNAGMQFGDFNCYMIAQQDDVERLYLSGHEDTFTRVDSADYVNALFSETTPPRLQQCFYAPLEPTTANMIKRLLERVEKIQDLHHYPACAFASVSYLKIGFIYSYLVECLFLNLSEASLRKMYYPLTCGRSQPALTANEINHGTAIDFYKSCVTIFYSNALTMAKTALELESSGYGESIAHNATAIEALSALLIIDGQHSASLREYRANLTISIQQDWETLYNQHRNARLPLSRQLAPKACDEEVLKILERHGAFSSDAEEQMPEAGCASTVDTVTVSFSSSALNCG